MSAPQLTGQGNIAEEIGDLLFEKRSSTEVVKIAKSLLDLTLNHSCICEMHRAKMIASICWEHGLNPPDKVKQLLL